MASPAAGRDVPDTPPRDERGPLEPSHPEPACQEAQKWIEAVTGKSFGDKDFRSALENGILLCELLSAIRPGLVKKINRLPTPIAGLDNLSVFLRGCEELGLKGSQLFDPGDLQDTSIRANLKDSDCNRKLKNVLNTVFWLGKAASGCASYSGPTLNLKEFEGLLAQMKMESEEGGDSPQKRSVRDSGYDCWDSERSESLSPPQHTRDNSLDSLDSFGSRSQHSPSPDVVNRGNSDGRGSDSEADAQSRKPDVRKDDMLARRTASSESRSSIPFNQFLPNRTNASCYIPTPRRKPHTEEGEQRSHSTQEQNKRFGLHQKNPKTVTWAPENYGEKLKQEEDKVNQAVLEQGRLQKLEKAGIKVLPAAVRYRSQVDGADLNPSAPPSAHPTLRTPEAALTPAELDACLAQYEQRIEEEDEEEDDRIPDLQKDDMMARRTGAFHKQSTATVTYNRFLPLPSSKRCTQDTADAASHNRREVEVDKSKKLNVRTFSQRVEQQQSRIPMETPQPQPDVIRSMSHSEHEYGDDEDEYDENEPVPNLEKDDMMARRTGSFQKPTTARTNQSFNQFLPVPGSVKYKISPVSAMKQLQRRPKLTEKLASESSVVTMAAKLHASPSKPPTSPKCAELEERQEGEDGKQKGDMTTSNTSVTDVIEPLSSTLTPPPSPASSLVCNMEADLERQSVEKKVEERVEEKKRDVNEQPRKKPFWLADDDLPSMMISRRVACMSEDTESVSMGDMLNEEEVGHLPPLSQSRYERMHEQYNNFQEDEEHWQDELARWKNRRRSASQELIKKEEERKRIEKRMKAEGGDGNKRKSVKTYKEIVEEKERREAELREAYRNAATPEEAAMVLQRYALRFIISDATLDSLKLPRSISNTKPGLNQVDKEHKPSSPLNDFESSEPIEKPEPMVIAFQRQTKPEEKETSVSDSTSSPAPNNPTSTVTNSEHIPPQSLERNEPQSKPTESPTTHQIQLITGDAQPQPKHSSPQIAQVQPHSTQPLHALPSPPSLSSRPLPLLAAKPYCQPRITQSGHKPVKMDGMVRVNGEETEALSVTSTPAPSCPQQLPQETEDITSKQTERDVPPEEKKNEETTEQPTPPQTEKRNTSSGSAISSLIEGRNCIITTTIVTELTHVEPHHPDIQSNGQVNGTTESFGGPAEEKKAQPATSPSSNQEYSPTVTEGLEESSMTIETPMLNLAKRVNHWVWDPNEERKRLERWQQEQERLLQEQYQREQERLKKEWEIAQLEVEEEERKHNEEERRILEETVTPLSPTGLLNQQPAQTVITSSSPENETEKRNVLLQQNDQRMSVGKEDQHASKLHFFQDSARDGEPSKKQELWKTASLDRNSQMNQAHVVKRSGSHDVVTGKQQSSSSSPQPPSPNRCVSGKRLCSGCSQPLGKGAAMIIDTLGLFFHIQCFKCGMCNGQLGDATAGTDVRIRNGLLSCHECYIASRGENTHKDAHRLTYIGTHISCFTLSIRIPH
ncbi:LIM and calponin homology domains-containing protein 1-like isoform X11 [Mastacembelus armatus]|uniref:LIM and calponin homology domains-containing protein 1-like isoform X11 n=1 Tax=Mastacembelus armatus TaxID=205130 RepID=UPI000E458BD9|nr:LIM and calponin homology domains-containing protein 1-like isoform X11 [Mastacembelus armatus]